MSLTIKELIEKSHNCAIRKGWWEDEHRVPYTVGDKVMEKLALIHSEVSEALEDYREGRMTLTYEDIHLSPPNKPIGFPSELADILIRVADLAGALGIDLNKALLEKMAYNETRPYRHGGKKA
jgi:NTP pyrophosphatase (non-canonical NTP hydrolase)